MTRETGTPGAAAEGAAGLLDAERGRPLTRLRWAAGLRLRQWLALIGGATATVVLMALAAGMVATIRLNRALETTTEYTNPASLNVVRLEKAMLEQEAGVRDYALTGRSSLLGRYERGRGEEAAALDGLRAAVAGGPERARRDLELTEQRVSVWRAWFAEPVIADIGGSGPAAVDDARLEQGRLLFIDVTNALRQQQDRLFADRVRARTELEGAESFLYACSVGIVAALVLVMIVFGLALHRNITLPLSRLGRSTRRVTTGDFTHTVQVTGLAEVVELAADVEAMRHRIVEELSAVRAAESQLRAQALELSDQADELRRSNAELEQFAYVASHDLQEPLRKIASFCQMLQRRYAGQLDERADQYLHFAVDGAKRMQTLINDLLAFSRVGRIMREHVMVDCDNILLRALDDLATAIEEAGAKVTADDLPTVPGDPTLLGQLFQNLIGNAIKFRGDQPPRVHFSARRSGSMWEFACADNGIGIDPQYADRIFIIFQRLHPKEDYPGTGLGLALCKKIVEYHGGRIWLDADTEQGTTIRWTLPATAPDPARLDPDPVDSPGTTLPSTSPPSDAALPHHRERAIPR